MLFTAVEARRVDYDKLTTDDTVVAAAHDFHASFENWCAPHLIGHLAGGFKH